jgi:hypothetical protein
MKEAFVSQSENDDIVKDVFIIIGYSIASIVIVLSLLWGYNTNTNIFIAIYSLVIILYNVMIISIVVMNKNIYDSTSYTVIFGTTIFSIFLTFFIGVFFVYKYFVVSTPKDTRIIQSVNNSYNY